ncbi:uncharacterized protein PITG_09082 [Phytophthora infestans T30-4]|uniref:Uncharacterized protein n=1 Tax=Phytophthora infestans (strain T30-4) TaxID=403677 RepID=D0NBN3_PHYIT|nr:uncharacterized protein PITG_09082 [Phytophthora infestans T30-4]EEY55188.1 conserved hypothetical protein [Phytophthora infestans T30-4]|eukprot:XP_002903412.1 conserved hypothetical protein [Phytophthora infestans T30-4]
MDVHAFKTLLQKALEQRPCVDVEVETENDTVKEVFLSLTYKFSSSISRKGVFQLPIVANDAPQSLVELLCSIHAKPPQSMLSEQQKADKANRNTSNIRTTAAVNPMQLKRRHMPTGTMRRRGPKGAKLAKK